MDKDSKIFIVGHDDIAEKSLLKTLKLRGFSRVMSSSALALDTTIQSAVYHFFSQERPDYVFLMSVKSGGIGVNQKYPAEFFYANSESQNNVVYAAHKFGAKKLMYVASSCAYPKDAPQPMDPASLLTGPVEKTSASYAMAKLAGIELCQAFRRQYNFNAVVVIPATVYGPEADASAEAAHVVGALMEKFFVAKTNHQREVVVWGTGEPRREFLFSEDFAEACLFLMERDQGPDILNIGSGEDVAIKDLANMIKETSGFLGTIVFDKSKPDGAMRKLLHSQKIISLGWKPKISIQEGIRRTWEGYVQEQRKERDV